VKLPIRKRSFVIDRARDGQKPVRFCAQTHTSSRCRYELNAQSQAHVEGFSDESIDAETFRRGLRGGSSLPAAKRKWLVGARFAANWNTSQAAELLHWSRMTVYRTMAKYSVRSIGHAVAGPACAPHVRSRRR
jgi:DNA-binding NtrC family response regulator